MLIIKDREEHVDIVFDFGAIVAELGLFDVTETYGDPTYFAEDYTASLTTAGLVSPQIEVARDFGDAALTHAAAPTVAGVKVTQRVDGGTPGQVYDVACLTGFTSGTDVRRLSQTVAVV